MKDCDKNKLGSEKRTIKKIINIKKQDLKKNLYS